MIARGNYLDTSPPDDDMVHQPNEQPPTYDAAVMSEAHSSGPYVPVGATEAKDVKVPPQEPQRHASPAASTPPYMPPSMPPTTVYNYLNARTGDVVTSLLPPDHPQMICLQEGHMPHSRFGILGVLAAVFWFPLGIGLCLLDRRVQCSRCGQVIDDGLCG